MPSALTIINTIADQQQRYGEEKEDRWTNPSRGCSIIGTARSMTFMMCALIIMMIRFYMMLLWIQYRTPINNYVQSLWMDTWWGQSLKLMACGQRGRSLTYTGWMLETAPLRSKMSWAFKNACAKMMRIVHFDRLMMNMNKLGLC